MSTETPTRTLTADTTTYNGNPSFSTIGKPHLDFYAGVTRQTDKARIKELAQQCWEEDPRLALITFFQKRNCRGGAGERDPFLIAFSILPKSLRLLAYPLIPQYGYWKDLNQIAHTYPKCVDEISQFQAEQLRLNMLSMIDSRIQMERGLEKWLPTEGCRDDRKWAAISKIIYHFNSSKTDVPLRSLAKKQLLQELNSRLKPYQGYADIYDEGNPKHKRLVFTTYQEDKSDICSEIVGKFNHILSKVKKLPKKMTRLDRATYRKWLVYRRAYESVVEHYKSIGKWEMIDYAHVPSLAFDRTKTQFAKHDSERFQKFVDQVKSGEKKIHTGQLMPFELIDQDSSEVRDQQWKQIVTDTKAFYQDVSGESIFHPANSIHVADVSGSMTCARRSNVKPISVSQSLAILMGEVGERPIYTFSGQPRKYEPTWDTLTEALERIRDPNYSTDFRKLIDQVHDDCMHEADRKGVSPSEVIPGSIFVYTDGGFDSMCHLKPTTAVEYIQNKFGSYRKVPVFVFWNVAGNAQDFAVQKDIPGVIQLSGFNKELYKLFTRLTNDTQLDPEMFFRMDVLSEMYQPVLKMFDRWFEDDMDVKIISN